MIVEELVSILGLEVGADALGTLAKFKETVSAGLSGLAGIGGIAAGAFVGVVASVAHLGDEIVNTSEKLGIATGVLQELRYAADQSDVSFDSLTTGLKFLSKNAAEAASGNKDALETFAGISLHNADGKLKTADELLFAVTDRFNEIQDPIKQTNLAIKLFGRAGTEIVPMLKQGTKGLEAFIDDAHDLGVILDTETLQASDDFDRSMKRLTSSLLGLRNTLGAPFVRAFADGMNDAANKIKTFQPHIKRLVVAIQDMWSRFKGVLGVIKALGAKLAEFFFKGNLLGAIVDATEGLRIFEAVVIGLGAVMIATAVSAAASWILALAPFILIAAVIGFILDDLNVFLEGGDSMLGRIIKWGDAVGDPNEHPVVQLLRKATAILFDLSDPKKWDALTAKILEVGGSLNKWLLAPILNAVDGLRTFLELVGLVQGSRAEKTQKDLSISGEGGIGDRLSHFVTGLPMDAAASAMSEPPSLPGGAAGPMASFAPTTQAQTSSQPVTVNQTNATTIDARGMDPEQLKKTLDEHADDRARASFAAVGVR